MELNSRDKGYAVMSKNLKGISIDGYSINELKRYCREGSVIVERIPKVYGFSILISWHEFYKPFDFKYSTKNIFKLHFQLTKEYTHKTGKIVYTPESV